MVEIQYQIARLLIAIVAALWSVEAVAASQILVYAIATVLYYRKVRDFDALRVRKCARALAPSVAVTLGSGIVPAAVLFWPGFLHDHMITGLAIAGLGAGVGWLLVAIATRHPLLDEMQRVMERLQGWLGAVQRR